ncbi:MAG: SpoIVB peptidase [Lachnospiraceae bacterium]|nr:SpoIVB peptidase [Lachnospiraceae bacterium]
MAMWRKKQKKRKVLLEEQKNNAAQEAVIFLNHWKKCVRRKRIIRRCTCGLVLLICCAFLGGGYYYVDGSIPRMIYLRAGEEQSIDLGVPAKAEIIGVSNSGQSNIPKDAITIDLNQAVTMKTGDVDQYQMKVKLFGVLPFKQVDIRVVDDMELIPVGVPVGIYMKTEGVLIVGCGEFKKTDGTDCAPAKYILKSGDYIHKIDGVTVTEKEDFVERIEGSEGKEMIFTVERDGEIFDQKITPMQDQTGIYKIGVWVRDNAQGVGTMTYMDNRGNFGALGHGINDLDTSTLMDIDDGTIYETEIISIQRGEEGDPGEMTGMIVYSDEYILGDITNNSEKGIFGVCNPKAQTLTTNEPLPIGFRQEIVKGPAQILSTVDGATDYYDVEITAIHLDHDNVNRGIEIRVTDPELISLTGGIIQGMSGSPIIQDGKIIGAVTHVLVNDPTRGYGIFIENMLEH